jgi:autotransporter-associated beta strand protein
VRGVVLHPLEGRRLRPPALLIANGGTGGGAGGQIAFFNDATGGTSQIEIFDNANLDISSHNAPGLTVGSIEGNGDIFLGSNNLTVGSNNHFTQFSGVIHDGGTTGHNNNGTGGSLTKIGTGILTLSGANTYTGGTTVNSGTLQVNNASGSGTGTGAVQAVSGTLGGTGTIAGTVTIGTGSGSGAFISPGTGPGTLTIQNALTLNSDATYKFELNSSNAVADKIVANGLTISGANFSFTDLGSGKLALNTVFTIIDNTSALPISGLFSNLADNSTFVNNGNTYQVSYEGGTGNDLTLTVVPEPSATVLASLGFGVLIVATAHRKRACSQWNRTALDTTSL